VHNVFISSTTPSLITALPNASGSAIHAPGDSGGPCQRLAPGGAWWLFRVQSGAAVQQNDAAVQSRTPRAYFGARPTWAASGSFDEKRVGLCHSVPARWPRGGQIFAMKRPERSARLLNSRGK
jgi:hypothetical protein